LVNENEIWLNLTVDDVLSFFQLSFVIDISGFLEGNTVLHDRDILDVSLPSMFLVFIIYFKFVCLHVLDCFKFCLSVKVEDNKPLNISYKKRINL